MADGLFDNRYRYDYIYPRGRSGETLRAIDTANDNQEVVIKRPAPNDAPPIRAGQEVSIRNERRALQELSGHPVLTELLDGGQFFVGGMPHEYIVMERAAGSIIADDVLEFGRRGERLPLLEILVFLDPLLDLLQTAHAHEIVYNDVDAKHLFWNRDTYHLKIIDWGNAVFLEGDTVTPQGISRQTDVAQVGELLYFILTGGRRAEVPRDAAESFQLSFGDDAPQIPDRLQTIVTKALHPNLKVRYPSITALREALNTHRIPLERDRDAVVQHVNERLRRDLSKNDLRGLLSVLEPALNADPGYPAARAAWQEIGDRLRDLDVSADLDAVRIYMEGGNWSRASDLLKELREKSGPQTEGLVEVLLDYTLLLLDNPLHPTPPAVIDAIVLLFEGHVVHAAHALLTQDNPDDAGRRLQWLLAERISSRYPEVLLLRPNLYRLEVSLRSLEDDGVNISDARNQLLEIYNALEQIARESVANLAALRDAYRAVVDRINTLHKLLLALVVQHELPHHRLPLTSLDRATNAAMALADNMHVIGKQAATSPRDAAVALDNSKSIDPTNVLWNAISRLLNNLYELLQSYQTYVPAADGGDLEGWLQSSRKDLSPFVTRLFDSLLNDMVSGLETAAEAWKTFMQSVVQGNREAATNALETAIQSVTTVSPTLAGWLNQLRSVVAGAQYIERHAISGGFGRALADGWEAFDRGRLGDAERLAQQAYGIGRTEPERSSARRLQDLASITREWIERNGILDKRRTVTALEAIEVMYKPDERAVRDHFATQMPSRDTYLRAMSRGLISVYTERSSTALRVFFANAVLLGALECHDGNLDDGVFWHDVAVNALEMHGAKHVMVTTLELFTDRRRVLNRAESRINTISNRAGLDDIERIRHEIEDNTQARLLAAAVHSLRELEIALREWAEGEFRAAGLKLESAINAAQEVEQTAALNLIAYKSWLKTLQKATAELHTTARQMRQLIERRPAEPLEEIQEAHRNLAVTSAQLIGAERAALVNTWHQTYEAFLTAYTDPDSRRSGRLIQMNDLFKAMFIDRHPAYMLYRHWHELTDNAPEFPAPPTNEPVPQIAEDDEPEIAPDKIYLGDRYRDTPTVPGTRSAAARTQSEVTQPKKSRRMGLLRWVVAALVAVLIVAVALVTLSSGDLPFGAASADDDDPTATAVITDVPTDIPTDDPAALAGQDAPTDVPTMAPTATEISASDTPEMTSTPETPLPTETSAGTDTPQPTETPTPSDTPTPSVTPTVTLPPQGLQGWQDLTAISARMVSLPWDSDVFAPVPDGSSWRLGIGQAQTEDTLITISLSPEMLDLYLGNDAPSRIRRTDATLTVTTYDPVLLENDDVYFGLLLRDADGDEVGLYIQVESLNVLNFYQYENGETTYINTRAVNNVSGRLLLERDPVTGNVSMFFGQSSVGSPLPLTGPDAPVQPVLFVHNGGVIVNVVNWRVGLR